MKVALCYHCVPHLTVEDGQNELAMDRFLRTYQQFDSGYPMHSLVWHFHDGVARDIASHRSFSEIAMNCDFVIFMSARVFFHRAGWLRRIMDAREKHGDGLYGIMASCEACPVYPENRPNPHLRTCFFGISPIIMATQQVFTLNDSFDFESGPHSITQRMLGRDYVVCKLVDWNGEYDIADWRKTTNGFRQGDQSNLLAHDRHSAAYDAATPEQQAMLTRIANGETI